MRSTISRKRSEDKNDSVRLKQKYSEAEEYRLRERGRMLEYVECMHTSRILLTALPYWNLMEEGPGSISYADSS